MEINGTFFLFLQKNHRSLVQTRLQVTHVEIVGIMKQTYEVFKHDGQEVNVAEIVRCSAWAYKNRGLYPGTIISGIKQKKNILRNELQQC